MSKNGSEVSDNQSAGSSQGSGGESNSPDANSALTPTNDNTNGQTRSGQTNGGQSSSSSSGSTGPGAAKRLPSYSYGNSNDNTNLNANVSGDCTYPMGDVKLWWRRAPKKQRDCYIKKNGIPDFLANEPYFCDYEKNEDCYVK